MTKFMENSPLKQPGILKSLLQGIEKIDNATTVHNISQKLAGELEKALDKPLNTIDTSEFEMQFNYIAYPLLTDLEALIRNLINERICKPYSNNIRIKIPEEIIEQWKRRKKSEEENRLIESDFSLIDYSDFTDLKKILEKGRN